RLGRLALAQGSHGILLAGALTAATFAPSLAHAEDDPCSADALADAWVSKQLILGAIKCGEHAALDKGLKLLGDAAAKLASSALTELIPGVSTLLSGLLGGNQDDFSKYATEIINEIHASTATLVTEIDDQAYKTDLAKVEAVQQAYLTYLAD